MAVAQSFAPLVDLIYPPRCPLCGEAIAAQEGLCLECWSKLVIPGEPACQTCQLPLAGGGDRCETCISSPPRHAGITAGAIYNDTARELVLGFKRGGKIALAPMLARLIAARLPQLEGDWIVVPVPLHRWRLWKRGFNQSALLGREVAQLIDANLLVDGLQRTRATPSLGGLGKRERREALKGAIVSNPARANRLQGARVLLVDDVLTSGATSEACIAALKTSGAAQVRVACFARRADEMV